MLETEFYPTPIPVIIRMISPIVKRHGYEDFLKMKGNAILDPQAGAGGILDYIQNTFRVHISNMYAIEIDPDLRCTLQGKGYKVIGKDFLEYNEPYTFDLILSNPPFSEGVTHALKAYELLSDGGSLFCLLNSQTIRNPCSTERERLIGLLAKNAGLEFSPHLELDKLLIKLEESNSIEWLGQCFKESERPTDVDVVIIRLTKPEKEKIDFDFKVIDFDFDISPDSFKPNTLAHADIISALVSRYNATRKILIERYQMQSKLDFYLEGISNPVYEGNGSQDYKYLSGSGSLNEQLSVLKSRFWNTIFEKTKLGRQTTSDFQREFLIFNRSHASMAFTVDNVKEVLFMFAINMKSFMMDSLIKVFDEATSHHPKNKVSEGWKTNKSWKLNKVIIMPNGVSCDYGGFRANSYSESFLHDLDIILCWISGTKIEGIYSTSYAITIFCEEVRRGRSYKEAFTSTFFRIKIYKKGTMHLEFLHPKYLEDFNRLAAEGKNWIGSGDPLD